MKASPPACLRQKIEEKIAEVAVMAEGLPGVVVIHNIQKDLAVEYMSARGLQQIGVTLPELQQMGKEFHSRFFNPIESADYIPKLIHGLLSRNDEDEVLSFFQQVRFHDQDDWMLHLSSIKIFMRDEAGQPLLTITIAIAVNPMSHITAKIKRVLEENAFLRQHYQSFTQLGPREREVLRLVALGKSSLEISQEMYISEKTVNTHRRNIRLKLNAQSSFEISQYARAFDLI
ncbi:response regulator transcription factor [Rufibacter hautae]|uniref:Helix-turn-helix transcriptional regulator n=1 Tax=Rufibacter hautae TaxID=2595005 RepID=A0A5B6TKL9_9BACT|nr:helix-turn-helix transcriptional regulator [Rufibacter hautae]KAA3439937.1 helix-turn-helix transcriptional regulator [Rufibacter hautae]